MNSIKASKVIEEILKSESKGGRCILINGEWGIGKTYSIENVRKNNNFKYISLFGRDDIKKIEKDLILQIEFKENSKKDKNIRTKVAVEALKKIAENYNFNLDLNAYLDNISIESLDNDDIIICIDDIERKLDDISIEDVLGLSERISTRFDLIIIGNISKLNEQEKIRFKEFKEKVVDFELFIDDLDDEQIKIIIQEFFEKQYDLISKESISQIINEFKKEGNIYNIRILKKFIELIKKVNTEINLIMNEEKFWLNELFIYSCYKVIKVNYLNEQKEYGLLQEQIEKIMNFDSYNIDIIKSFFDREREVIKDAYKLQDAYKLDLNDLNELIDKVIMKIKESDLDYFNNQEDVLPINEGLQYILKEQANIKGEEIEQSLLDIAIKLYNPRLDGSIKIFNSIHINPLKDIHPSTLKLKDSIEIENFNIYIRRVKEELSNAFESKDYSKYRTIFIDNLTLINQIYEEEYNFFSRQFKIVLKELENEFCYELWDCISELLKVSSKSIINEYIENNKDLNLLTKLRLRELQQI